MDFGQIINLSLGYIFSPVTIAYALAAVGLAVHFGYAGLLNFGMAGFMAIGAYGYAISILSFGLPWWVGILIGCVGAMIFAFILGIPTLRLRADYLAIVTIAAAEIVRLLFTTQVFDEYTNSADGLGGYHAGFRGANPFPPGTYGFGPFTYSADQLWVRVFGLVLLGIAVYLVWALMRSPWGRVLKGIREDEDAVRSLGKNIFAYKMQALMIGGVFGALGGVVFALPSAVVPAVYQTSLTFFIWTILLLGGAATVFGPVVGAVIFWVLMAFLDAFLPALAAVGVLPITSIQAATLRFILVGVALMLIVIFRPQGIFGNKRELTFVK
ncbi:branched-chain amino acid ABC transporter permease [Microbacterium aurantiacum]|uniref:Branched-chain amino acid ABC transporter permease n=2 Tax=Microbacterium aurantiacum TaxID=162393 RepID=A0AAJ2HHU8_9MICO|nr:MULTISPECIES: branched-chain amino acid ABC transporter permease [Microbacterium]ODT10309.1 MAG: branched-chain amino acid ABC transporter permease [Microbacterium sp. SCN 70-18]ANG85106.1 branched-chain amino acid ABC transporter permease [Microbacterium chocolatum]KOS10183.1 branched-chain amino acid ABC transporter permease [Microbacterium chocolatum]MBN9202211.1 branched-chain amino acid ABC transporter permease [Microbacterium chocolatum]MDN4465587.1 branched-chain amino acid ABC trans